MNIKQITAEIRDQINALTKVDEDHRDFIWQCEAQNLVVYLFDRLEVVEVKLKATQEIAATLSKTISDMDTEYANMEARLKAANSLIAKQEKE